MSTLLTSLNEKIDTSEPAPEETPDETAEETSDTPEETESVADDTETITEDEPEDDGQDPGRSINPRKKYVIDGKEVTGKELLDGRLMRDDYTRKTQKLSEYRKQLDTRMEEVTDERDEAVDWIQSLEDAETMEAELFRRFPEAVQKLIDRAIDFAIEEEDAGENQKHREALRKARQADLAERQRKIDEKRNQTKEQRKEQAVKTAELRANFDKWTREAMAEAGLDFNSEKHRTVFTDRIMSAHGKEPWSQDTFKKTAKYTADLFDLKPVKKPEPAPKAKALPPVAKTGASAPVKERQAKKAPAVRKDSADYYANLRAKYS